MHLLHGIAGVLILAGFVNAKPLSKPLIKMSPTQELSPFTLTRIATATKSFNQSETSNDLIKRQANLRSYRHAVVWYECPVSGPQIKTFAWEAHFDAETSIISLHGKENIDAWDHITVVTNDFGSSWHHRTCQLQGRLCCVYQFLGTVVGTIYDDHIDMVLITPRIDHEHRVRVAELCIDLVGNLMCPLQACPVGDVYHNECSVVGTIVSSHS